MATNVNRRTLTEDTKREEEFLKKKLSFRSSALLLIKEMVKLTVEHPSMLLDEVELTAEHRTLLMDEILHSIFFFGKLDDPEFSPESLASNDDEVDMLKMLRKCFPRSFDLYSSQVPKRSPFSCVLDMIVRLYGRKNDEKEIIERLQKFVSELEHVESNDLVSSTICVSQSNIPESVKYYGVSMSSLGLKPGRIMVAASCLSSWDSKVADAVMTYKQNKKKKSDFDGTVKLQPYVRCQAFNIRLAKEMPPCRSCGNLFGLETSEIKEWAYGNCAEAESLSNLLKNDEKVREQVQPTSEKCTDENRKKVKESVLTELKSLLGVIFYDPRV